MSFLSDYMNSEIEVDDTKCLVVTNFAYDETIAGEPINAYSGLSEEAFNYLIEETVSVLDAEVTFCDGNTAIVTGGSLDLQAVQQVCGDRFSYATCTVDEAGQVVDACLEAATETPEQREERRIPGAVDYVQHLN